MPQTRKDGPYRITGLHPWPSAGPADVLVEILSHGFVGQEVDADELELLVAAVGGQGDLMHAHASGSGTRYLTGQGAFVGCIALDSGRR